MIVVADKNGKVYTSGNLSYQKENGFKYKSGKNNTKVKASYKINDKIIITYPTIQEIKEYGEQKFNDIINLFCFSSSDYGEQLFNDYGVDCTQADSFDLFCMLYNHCSIADTSIIFGDIDIRFFVLCENTRTKEVILYDSRNDIVIDKKIYKSIRNYLQQCHKVKTDYLSNFIHQDGWIAIE